MLGLRSQRVPHACTPELRRNLPYKLHHFHGHVLVESSSGSHPRVKLQSRLWKTRHLWGLPETVKSELSKLEGRSFGVWKKLAFSLFLLPTFSGQHFFKKAEAPSLLAYNKLWKHHLISHLCDSGPFLQPCLYYPRPRVTWYLSMTKVLTLVTLCS